MKGKKNDYSITFLKATEKGAFEKLLHLAYVHSTKSALLWYASIKKNNRWQECTHYSLYNRRTRQFLGTFNKMDLEAVNNLAK